MAKARALKGRIRSVTNTRKITKTMELVATSKLKRAQDRVVGARPYAEALRQVISDLVTPELAQQFPLLSQPAAPDKGSRLTQAGLPRRVPRANLAPGMVATEETGDQPPPGPASGRSPDEVRSMLSSYRTGIERGRTVAGGSDPGEQPPDGP